MALRLVLALACLYAALGVTSSAAAPATAQLLALRLTPGDRIVQHSELIDGIDWQLPPERLETFRSQGVVINEEVRTTIVATGVVESLSGGAAHVSGEVTTTVHDVPRNKTLVTHDTGVSITTARNVQTGTSLYALEDAPMIDLPATPVSLGTRWTTKQRVVTSLGSGVAVFQHVVAAIDGDVVRVDVTGRGVITGKEYNLPSLLPGTIALRGSAWFDADSGLISQESYAVDNTLVKTSPQGPVGFIEHLDADTDVHKEGRTPGRLNSTAP
jgi:hypothetical protein